MLPESIRTHECSRTIILFSIILNCLLRIEILGMTISLIYHFLDPEQVSDLSHIGQLWNDLPESLLNIESFNVFLRTPLKDVLLTNF